MAPARGGGLPARAVALWRAGLLVARVAAVKAAAERSGVSARPSRARVHGERDRWNSLSGMVSVAQRDENRLRI